MSNLSGFLFSLALALELAASALLFSQYGDNVILLGYIALHGQASVFAALVVWLLLPHKYRFPKVWSLMFLFLICFFIPFVGIAGLMTGVLVGLYLPKNKDEDQVPWKVTTQPKLPHQAPVLQGMRYSSHGMISRLEKTSNPQDHLSIVLSTRYMKDENAIPILRTALRNPEDDVRLLAYSLLDRKESEINTKIEHLMKLIDEGKGTLKSHLHIARHYWELAYLGLAQDEVRDHALGQSLEHLDIILQTDPKNGSAHFIYGQIMLKLRRGKEAEEAFLQAYDDGFTSYRVYSYLAEASFQQRLFHKIPEYLKHIPEERRRYPPISNLVDYWLRDESAA